METIALWKTITRFSAGALVFLLLLPVALPAGSEARFYCWLAAGVVVAVCLYGAQRTRDEEAARAAVDATVVSLTPATPGGGFSDGAGLDGGSDD